MSAPDGQVLAGRFRVEARIGAGTTAIVYRAADLTTGELIALKLAIPPGEQTSPGDVRMRFDREAAALSVLVGPHVVRLVASGRTEDDRPYLALELLSGHTLYQELRDSGPIAPDDVVRWLGQAASALELAHGVGIVHRDLKPQNLFLHQAPSREVPSHEHPSDRILKILDFGLVKDAAPQPAEDDALIGTPLFMAPEQARAQQSRIGPATDVWALGMVAVTLLTGEPYWETTSVMETMAEVDGAPLYPPSTRWTFLSRAFDDWFARSCHRVAEKRFRSVTAQVAALPAALSQTARRRRRGTETPAVIGTAPTVASRTPTPTPIRRMEPGRVPLVGRQVELVAIDRLLRGHERRTLITLTGPGGAGKSRLADEVARTLGSAFPDGVWTVPLGGVREPSAVPDAISKGLGLEPDSTRPVVDLVTSALEGHTALLVLDGFEHLVSARALVTDLRARLPAVTWLVTSRSALGVPDEHVLAIAPLEVPAATTLRPSEAQSYAAVDLFVRRAAAARPDFRLTAANVADVVAICRQADGLPLALELAAAQVVRLELGELRRHMHDTMAGADDGLRRPERRVRDAVAWSCGLLTPEQQALLRKLAVLPGGVTFRDLRELSGGDPGAVAGDTLALVGSSLVEWSADEPPRLRMLEAVREFCRAASERLGEEPALWRAAAGRLELLTERADAGMQGSEQEQWLALLDAEHDNLRAVLARALEEDVALALRLAGRLAWFWYVRGHYEEGRKWLEISLAHAEGTAGDDKARRRALTGAGRIALLECRYARAERWLVASRQLATAAGDPRGIAGAEQLLGSVARERGDYAAAARRHRRALQRFATLGARREVARSRNYLCFLAWLGDPAGHPTGADPAWAGGGAEAELRALGDREGTVWALLNRGAIALYAGEPAEEPLELAFSESVAVKFQEGIAWALNLLGLCAHGHDDAVRARARLRASLRVHRRLGDLWRCASVLEALAAVDMVDEAPRAALLVGAAGALRGRTGTPVPACERWLYDVTAEQAAESPEARDRGAELPLDDVIALVLE